MFMLTKRKLCTKEKPLQGIQTQDFTLLKKEQTTDNCKLMTSLLLLNYQLSQKFKLIERSKFNHLINTLTLSFTCELKLPFNRWGPTREIFNLHGK
jgi:hypothetical protein